MAQHPWALGLGLAALLPASAAEWTWNWRPAAGDPPARATVATFKYGKSWLTPWKLTTGPSGVRSFAVPFLARYHFTDAPPGVTGGKPLSFVGSVSVIASGTGFNDANLNWEDLKALQEAGWGVLNHSFDHRGRGWDGAAGQLSDAAVREDAFWSQTMLAAACPAAGHPLGWPMPTATPTTTAAEPWPKWELGSPRASAAAARGRSPVQP